MRIVVDVQVEKRQGGTVAARALIDSGAEANVVSQRLVKEGGWTTTGVPAPLKGVNQRAIYVYGSHELAVAATDSGGETRTQRHSFTSIDMDAYTLILGYPWLYDANPDLNWQTQAWRFRDPVPLVEILDPADFAQVLNDEPETHLLGVFLVEPESTAHRLFVARVSPGQEPEIPEEYADFAETFDEKKAAELPPIDGPTHAIELEEGAKPPHGPIYALAEPEQKALQQYLEEKERRGWIQRSVSPAGAPILFVPKKDGGLRLCVDYRGLNKVTIKNRTPLPLISETLDRFSRAKVFTKLDLKDAYNRIRIRAGDEWKTAFRTRYGHFEYRVMPFGLCNAPATFQQYINEALAGLIDVFCVVYLDDILIFSEELDSHTTHVREVLLRLRRARLFVNLKKCDFRTSQVEFLGFVISTTGVSMEESRVVAITEWPTPQNMRDVQVFLGFANFYRRFIHLYSKITAPLSDVLRGGAAGRPVPFDFTTAAQTAFEALKQAFVTAPVLAHFAPALRTMVETDASMFAIGAVLSQLQVEEDTSRWHPVAYISRKLNPTQQAYGVGDQEMFAIVEAFEQWRHYLSYAAQTVIVKTDHQNLKDFLVNPKPNRRQVRWIQQLAEYDFVIEYRPGKSNPADGPSRRPDHKPEGDEVVELLLPSLREKLRGAYRSLDVVLVGEERQILALQSSRESSPPREVRGERKGHLGRLRGGRRKPGRNPPLESDTPRETLVETPAPPQVQPVAGTGFCRPLVPRSLAALRAKDETVYGLPSQPLTDLIRTLQRGDAQLRKLREAAARRQRQAGQQKGRKGVPPASRGSRPTANIPRDPRKRHEQPSDVGNRSGASKTPSPTLESQEPACLDGGASSRSCSRVGGGPKHASSRVPLTGDPLERDLSRALLVLEQGRRRGPQRQARQLRSPSAEPSPRQDSDEAGSWEAGWTKDADGVARYKGKVYVPEDQAVRAEILTINHDDPIAGHFGVTKTLELLKRKYYWPKMRSDVKRWVQTCAVCQRNTTKRHRPHGLLAPLPRPEKPWVEISMDFITGLPPSAHRGHVYDSILVIVDRYTKLARYIPCTKTIGAGELADLFMEYWVKDFGTPKGIISDRGPQFTSKFWSSLCFYLQVRRRLSTAFHPQTDGQTEVQNQTLEHYLRAYSTYYQDDWAAKLLLAEFTYNNSLHSTIGASPFYAAYGTNPEIRLNVEDDVLEGRAVAAQERAQLIRDEREVMDTRWRSAVESQKKFYDKRHKPADFATGDQVMLSTKNLRLTRPSRKLAERFLGPLVVKKVMPNGLACELEMPPALRRLHPVFHVSLLEPYYQRDDTVVALEIPDLQEDLEQEWEVEAIVGDRTVRGKEEFLIRWKGYGEQDDTWEPAAHLGNADEAMEAYQKRKSQAKAKSRSRRARRKE